MAIVIFVNPNDPEQPICGVYRWYAKKQSDELTLYIGQAGSKMTRCQLPSTLGRGVSELQRAAGVSSESGKRTLDTDFIVGTAIQFFREKGYDCLWEHLCDDPQAEREYCKRYHPFLQDVKTGNICAKYKAKREDGNIWSNDDVRNAESVLYGLFSQALLTR